jgi:glycosyltransferase involved in cell wall biosynthesis
VRRIVHYYPGAMGHSGVTFALWSWARAQALGGAEVQVLHAPGRADGSDVAFVSPEFPEGLTSRAIDHAGGHRLTRRPVALERYLGHDDLLVLHEGWVPSNLVAAAAARRMGVPYIVMPHGVYERLWTQQLKPPMWLRRRLERRLLEGAAAVHVFFDSEISDIAAIAPTASFITVPTGFDVPEERWIGGGGYLAWVGRVDPVHKGLDTLVSAVRELSPAERPTVRIHGYDYKGGIPRLRTLIADAGVGRWVHLEPAVGGAEKMRLLQQADGYVHPSRWECHSIALLENLALGVPCLVSSTIHIAPTLRDARAAVLTPPTEHELAGALSQWTTDRTHVAGRGRDLVARAFNWKAIAAQFQTSLGHLGLQA